MKKIEKPLILKIEDFRKNIISTINKSEIPVFMVEYIFKDIYQEVREANIQYTQIERQRYQTELAESNKDESQVNPANKAEEEKV